MSSSIVHVIYIKNPLDPYTDLERGSYVPGKTVLQFLKHRFGKGFGKEKDEEGKVKYFERPTLVLVNGEPVFLEKGPGRKTWAKTKLKADDVITLATLAGTVVEVIIYAVILIVAIVAVVVLMGNPIVPGNQKQADSVYNLSGQKNRVRLDEPIEVSYGRVRSWPSYGASVYTQYIGNEQYNFSLYCLGQGSHTIHAIQIEDTPIDNYPEAEYELVQPNELVTLFPDNVVTSIEINNIELKASNEPGFSGWSGPYILNPAGTVTDKVEVDVGFPQGLFATYEGSVLNVTVMFEFQLQKIGDDGVPIGAWTSLGVTTVTKRTNTPQRYTYSYDVSPGRYQIRGQRTNTSNLVVSVQDTTMWESARAFLPSVRHYGDVTMLAVKIRATNSVNNNAQQRVNVIHTRHIPTWSPEGGWTEPMATRSIVWAFCDIFRSKYGCKLADDPDGDLYLDLLPLYNLDQLFISRDEHFDFEVDTELTVFEIARTVARTGRSIPLPVGSRMGMSRDSPKTLISAVFSPENIIKDSFKIDYRHPAPDETDHVLVSFKDPVTWIDQEVACVLPGYTSNNPEKVTFAGCTSRVHAYHEGMYIMSGYAYVRDTITFKVGLEGHIPTYNDKILVRHDVPNVGLGSGFVLGLENGGTVLHLSNDVNFDQPVGTLYVIVLRRKDGTGDGPYYVEQIDGDPRRVTLSAAISPDNFIFDDFSEPPIYLFGVSDMVSLTCKIIELNPSDSDDTIEVVCVNWDDRLYEWDSEMPPPVGDVNYVPKPPDLPVVTSLTATVDPYNTGNLIVGWTPAAGALSYILESSADNISWDKVVEQAGISFVMQVPPGTLYLRVSGVRTGQGPYAYWTGTAGIPAYPPAAPAELVAVSTDTAATASWQPSTGAASYRVAVYSDLGTVLRRTEVINALTYAYTLAMAQADGTPERHITFDIVASNANGDSSISSVNCYNDQVAAPINLRKTLLFGNVYRLEWDLTEPADFYQYKVYASSTSGFTPGPGNLVYTGTNKQTNYNTGGSTHAYFRVSSSDKWGSEESISTEFMIV